MSIKRKYRRIKHITFNLIDLLCLIISFFLAYSIKFKSLNIFIKVEWPILLAIMCIVNVCCAIIQRTYKGILKRRYYQQFQKELLLFLTQFAMICILLFVLKVGDIFSRQVVFTTYFSYFVLNQVIKYVRKKSITGEISFCKKKSNTSLKENKDVPKPKFILNKNELKKLVNRFIKRSFDIVVGIIGCIILIPLSLIVFIINKLSEDDDGPLFYVQERIGENGTIFKMIKYRSMVVDAEEKLKQFLEENEDIKREYKIYRKLRNDPRITKVGAFLRKTSLDEMPQFINVLIGNMSLVGPRPYLPREKKAMGDYYEIIIKYKPGITGLWQISGRSNVSFKKRLELDEEYHKTQSVRKDFAILLKTIKHIIKKEGAI